MKVLAGKRAVVGGINAAHANTLAAVLAAHGADVATRDEPGQLDGVDIVVVCPPPATQYPGADLAATLPAIAASGRWALAAAEAMRPSKRGVIVHVMGLSGLGGWPGWQASGATFAAVRNIVQSHSVELAPHGVRVNALVPGVSAELAAIIANATGLTLDAVRARIPTGAFMTGEDLGNALLYLVHDSSSYVTGETLTVDGGWHIWGRLHAAVAR